MTKKIRTDRATFKAEAFHKVGYDNEWQYLSYRKAALYRHSDLI